MRTSVLVTLIVVLAGGVASAGLSSHSYNFTLANTGSGVSDGRLRFHIDKLAVPGEDYFIDNVSLTCGGPEIVVNGDFSAGQGTWKFFSNAPAPKPTIAIVDEEAVITFGKDGSNTQLFQKDLMLPAVNGMPVLCTLTFDACSTGGPGADFGHNFGLKLQKHGKPYTNYGLSLSGSPSNPEVDLLSCSTGPSCGNDNVDTGLGEECDDGGVNTMTCDSDCTLPACDDGVVNPAAGEECDDGPAKSGVAKGAPVQGDGCDANCLLEPYCGNGQEDIGEDCDGGGGTFESPTAMETALCNRDCTDHACGDGVLNRAAGEQCDDGNMVSDDGCDDSCQLDLDLGSDCDAAWCALISQLGGPVPTICPRFIDNLNGTVTDTDTGYVWLKNASCFGFMNWANSNAAAAALGGGQCGLTDGSIPGDWHLPSLACPSGSSCDLEVATGEFSTIFALSTVCNVPPYIPNAADTGCLSEGDAFSGVQTHRYWSSTTLASNTNVAFDAFLNGGVVLTSNKVNGQRVWPVRSGP